LISVSRGNLEAMKQIKFRLKIKPKAK